MKGWIDSMKKYKKMTAVIVDLAEKLDEVVMSRQAVPALAGANVSKFTTNTGRFGISASGDIQGGSGISMVSGS